MSQFKELYERVLHDEDFRDDLLADPAAALKSMQISTTPEVLAAVCGIIEDVRHLQKELKARPGEMEECVS
jgi:hypothetical protein